MNRSRVAHSAEMKDFACALTSLLNSVRDIVSQNRRKFFQRQRIVATNSTDFSNHATCSGRYVESSHRRDLFGRLTDDFWVQSLVRRHHDFAEFFGFVRSEEISSLCGQFP